MGDDKADADQAVVDDKPDQKTGKGPPQTSQADANDPGCICEDDIISPCEKSPDQKSKGPCGAPPDDDDDDDILQRVGEATFQLALGDALKPIKMERLAVATIGADPYETLKDGLQKDYDNADKQFMAIATELDQPSGEASAPLQKWIDKFLGPTGEIQKLYRTQQQKEARLLKRTGYRECLFRQADAKAKQWKAAYDDWKSPSPKIKAIIDSYKDQLRKLAADFPPNGDYEIYQFWFEIAPKHLRLRPADVTNVNAPGIARLCAALKQYPARRRKYASEVQGKQGDLFLVDTKGLSGHRTDVLDRWEDAVKCQVRTKVAFDLLPDDAASLTKDLAKLATDEPTTIKNILQPKP